MSIHYLILGESFDINVFLKAVMFMNTEWYINHLWFLGVLIAIYIIFPALKALFDTDEEAFKLFTIVITVLFFGRAIFNHLFTFICRLLQSDIANTQFILLNLLNIFGGYGYTIVYFCLGGLIRNYEKQILSISKQKRNCLAIIIMTISCISLFFLAVYFSFNIGKTWNIVWNSYYSIFTLINTLCIYVLCLNYHGDNVFIRNISQNTLGIYIIHRTLIVLTQPLMKSIPVFCNLPVSIIYAFVLMCVSYGICILMKKVPVLRKLI